MSTLTNKERDGLEDVFLSINSNTNKYKKMKELSSLILLQKTTINFANLFKQAKVGLKETKLSQFLLFLSKKKKHLRK